MDSPTDFLGRTIAVDNNLVYPVRRGSRMWLNRIQVTKVECDAVYGNSPEGRGVKLTNLKNTVVVS
jgi:expansin (peptidoglycan-binding protein)